MLKVRGEINIAFEGIKEAAKEGYGIFTHGLRSPVAKIEINRAMAVNYAIAHCGDNDSRPANPDYPFFDYDCTNFVAQCWNYAGLSKAYDYYCDGIYTNSYYWVNVDGFYNYVTTNEIARVEYGSAGIRPGDIIQFRYRQTDGTTPWMHSAIITGYDSVGGLCYTGHADRDHPQYNKPLSEVYPEEKNSGVIEVRFLVPLYPTYYTS